MTFDIYYVQAVSKYSWSWLRYLIFKATIVMKKQNLPHGFKVVLLLLFAQWKLKKLHFNLNFFRQSPGYFKIWKDIDDFF